ncbi:shikimate kinase [Sediminibacterium sp.]|uniref:shikimate kinase n=1 Tax=Sediminibacterium sp. TaxID=1917865 RepID=UPI0027366816|nr:shikimate kinase [Sediminibacterium sp.]MDP3393667.1 shikimate kinase [Sediminibacterium sp.]MDP3566560.1 shikimate kinase [Sediminibacterium sp.]
MKIFLIGMMGSGKSFWKQRLSAKLKTGGYDLDGIIESVEEKSVTELFEEEGEIWFRKTEAKLLRWFGEKKSFVLATGGGTPCFHQNMEWMNQQGITIWLDEPVEVLVERLLPEMAQRPLLKNLSTQQLQSFIQNKLTERRPFYNQAKKKLSGSEINLKNLIVNIQ